MMENKKIIIIISIAVVILVLCAAGISLYYFMSKNNTTGLNGENNNGTPGVPKTPEEAEYTQEMQKEDYPEVITGTIKFLDSANTYKSTLTTSDGKVYTLSPDQPSSIYGSFGAKNGGKVKIQGRYKDDKIEWTVMESI